MSSSADPPTVRVDELGRVIGPRRHHRRRVDPVEREDRLELPTRKGRAPTGRPALLVLHDVARVDPRHRGRDLPEVAGELVVQRVGAVGRGEAHRQGRVEVDAVESIEQAAHHVPVGHSQDADGDVQAHLALRLCRVVGVGRQVEHVAGGGGDGAQAGHVPGLVPGRLEDQHVMVVGVPGEPPGAGRREVGVGLHRVAQLAFEAPAQVDQRRPGALQGLEHQGGATVDRLGDLGHVGHVVEGGAPHPDRRRGALGRQPLPVLHEAERGPPCRRQQEGFGVLDVEEIGEVQAAGPHERPAAPVVVGEGIHVSHQVRQRQAISGHLVSPRATRGMHRA